MDSKNDVIVTFDYEKKEAYALPNMMKLGAVFASQKIKEQYEEFSYEKTGKTKKICGYKAVEYKGISGEKNEEYKFYMAEDFPVSWADSYSGMMGEMAPTIDMGKWEEVKGMVLKSESNENGKQLSKWEAKKVDLNGITVNKSDYDFKSYMEAEN